LLKTAEHYSGDSGRVYHEQKRGIPDSAFDWIAQSRAKKIAPHINPTDTVFEYGVGWGWNLGALKCARKFGFDISNIVREKVTARGIEWISAPDKFAEGSADVVICHHTLEHLLDPVAGLKQIKRLLRADGKLLLFVPFERESKYTRFDPAEPNHHLYSWNAQTLGNLVQETGFKVVEATVAPFGYDRFSAVWAARLNVGHFGFKFIRSCAHLLKPAFEVRIVVTH
jgi:SAM-dependent methyltransferase